jgi:hypothetical protein
VYRSTRAYNSESSIAPGDEEILLPIPVDPLTVAQFWVRVAMSFCLLGAALYIILSKRFQPKDKHWAYGLIGILLGYWLKM